MAATLVPAVRTPCTPAEMIEGFVKGWIKLNRSLPKKEQIGVLYSQTALETGLSKSMWNFNFGNVKYVPNKYPEKDNDKLYCMLNQVWEILGGKKVIFNPPHPATWFRAFPTLADGVADHLNFLKNTRYKKSWAAVEVGNPTLFAQLLKSQGYYTAPVEDYIKSMNYFFQKFMKDNTFEKVISNLDNDLDIPVTNYDIQPTTVIINPELVIIDPLIQNSETELTNPEEVPLNLSKWQSFIQQIMTFIKSQKK